MDTILKRRSVRSYDSKEISKEDLNKILKAGMRAPSAGNEQVWEFVVTKDRSKMLEIIELSPYAKMLETADSIIVVCGDIQKQKYPYDFWIQDCSACTQNMLLQATDLGIGSVWVGIYPIEERVKGVQKIFELPENVVPLSVVSLGYPKKEYEQLDTFVEEKIHYDKW